MGKLIDMNLSTTDVNEKNPEAVLTLSQLKTLVHLRVSYSYGTIAALL